MKHLKQFNEASGNTKQVLFTGKRNQRLLIKVDLQNGRVSNIEYFFKNGKEEMKTDPFIKFPLSVNQTFHMGIETWACNNQFFIDGKDTCPEEKIFGIKKSLAPPEARMLYPHKFR
jgi:hypothetical protein